MLRRLRTIVFVQAALACLLPLTLCAQNLIPNPGFETPTTGVSPGTPVAYTNFCSAGNSAAAIWTVFVNSCGTNISTTLVPSTLPGGGKYMMHVVTNGNANGIVHCCFTSHTKTLSSAWVYVNSGCVGMGTGNGGDTNNTDEMTCEIGSWIQFKAPNGVSPANEFIVYSVITPGADFYVDNVKVVGTP